MDNLIASFYNFEPIYEVLSDRSPYLKDIDNSFGLLLKDITNKQAKKDLILAIKKFTRVSKIYIRFVPNIFNACILTNYNNILPSIFIKKLESENIKHTVDETSQYIDSFRIDIGIPLFNTFNKYEMTAILLHELGHVYSHTSNLPLLFQKILKWSSTQQLGGTIISTLLHGISLYSSLFILAFIVSRSVMFTEHLEEYNCDQFAIKYGYGTEIATAINKIRNIENTYNDDHAFINKLLKTILSIFIPASHPDSKDRICNIINKIKKEYSDRYNIIKDDINNQLSDIKC